METFLIADTHWGHANILKHANRPFADVQEMNETLIANWNRLVGPKDLVYHLGDFAFRNKEAAMTIRRRLNGTIRFIEGNHDASAFQIRHSFEWYKQLHSVEIQGQQVVLCHYALRVWHKSHYGAWHLYGHSHGRLAEGLTCRSMDVGVDATAMRLAGVPLGQFCPPGTTRPQDYRPLHFSEVAAILSQRRFVPVDHHGAEDAESAVAT